MGLAAVAEVPDRALPPLPDPQPPQPTAGFEDRLVDGPECRPGDAGFFRGLPLTGVMQEAARDLREVQCARSTRSAVRTS